jgi:hypothetical protein
MTTLQDVVMKVKEEERKNVSCFVVEVKSKDCKDTKQFVKTIKKYYSLDVHHLYHVSDVEKDGIIHMHFYRK